VEALVLINKVTRQDLKTIIVKVPSGRREIVGAVGDNILDNDNISCRLLAPAKRLSVVNKTLTEYLLLPFRYPWDIFANIRYLLENHWFAIADYLSNAWQLNEISPHVFVAPTATISADVIFRGPVVIGPRAVVRNAAIVGKQCIIMRGSRVEEYCRVAKYSLIGPEALIGHCAEVSGTIFGRAKAKHFSYFRGVLGVEANLGAGTLCGTERFDGGNSTHERGGGKITIQSGANEIYLGRGARTGVGTCLLAGTMLGEGAAVGPNLSVSGYVQDGEFLLPNNSIRRERTK
jgi:NDP-sugar pyrophosphorylase family protein